MGKIKINETASEPIDMKKGSKTNEELNELIMPIEHYVTVSAKVENPEAGVSVEGVKSAPRKRATGAKKTADVSKVSVKSGGSVKVSGATKTAGTAKATGAVGRKKTLALPAGSIGAAVIDEKVKAAGTTTEKKAKLMMDGMVKTGPKTVEVKDAPVSAKDEFEAHRPKEKKIEETDEEDEKPRFSKPKAVLIGVAVALAVALVGWLVIGLMGRSEPARCIVQFESNGGSKVESEEVVCGEKVERPDDPTKEGFAFQSWIYGGSPFDFEQMTIDEDLILVAKWAAEEGTEIVTIHFDTAGGSEIDDIEVKKGSTVTAPVEPTRESYAFVGWKLDGEDFDFSQPVEEDITLVAEWEPLAGGNNSGSNNSGATPQKPSVEILAASDTTIMVGMTKMIDVTVSPSNADYKLAVSSSNASVAVCSVTDDARLKCEGKGAGETTVMVRDVLSGKQTQFKITGTSEVTFVSLDRPTLSLMVGDSDTLRATVTASGGASVTATWTSSNPNVATVDANGRVTAVAAGDATITVTAGGISASCAVRVTKPSAPVTPPTDPDLSKPDPDNPDPDAGEDATTTGD